MDDSLAKIRLDYEEFLREIEEDPDLRSNFNLYKGSQMHQKREMAGEDVAMDEGTDEEEDQVPQIPLEELLDELTLKEEEEEEIEDEAGLVQ